MKNTLIIILAIIFLLAGAWYVFKPVPKSENEIRLEAESKALKDSVNTLQSLYDLEELKNKRLMAELLKSKAVVKRSEDQLTKAKANEKVYLKRIKEQTLAMSEIQADSVIKERFKHDPDSLGQKTVMEFARLDQCSTVRLHQDSALHKIRLHEKVLVANLEGRDSLLVISRTQNSLLQSSSQIDKQLLQIKDKENKKLRRGNKFLKGGIGAVILYGVVRTFVRIVNK